MKRIGTGNYPVMLLSLALGTFMAALDTSVVNIAVPVIQAEFGAELATVEWVIISYLLVVSSLLLTFGRLSDIHGHKKVYLAGFCIFTLGSLLCSLSTGIEMLVAFRVVQALGSGMMFSTSSAIITDNVAPEKRGGAFGVIAVAVAAAGCAGPVLGGFLADLLGWQSVFYINVPIGIVGIILAAKWIPKDGEQKASPFDIKGALVLFAALFLILLPLNLAGDGLAPALFFAMLAAGLVLGGIFLIHERRTSFPMIRLTLFRSRVFSASLIAAAFCYMAQYIVVFMMPQYFQNDLLLSPSMAGLAYLPFPLATIVIAPVSGSFSDRHDSRILSSAGMGVMALGLFLVSFARADTSRWYVVLALVLTGIGSGMFQSPNNSAVMGSAPAEQRGAASGTLAMMRNVGMVLGVAAGGALFGVYSLRTKEVLSSSGLTGEALKLASFSGGFRPTFLAAAGFAVLAMVASFVKGKVRRADASVGIPAEGPSDREPGDGSIRREDPGE